MGFEIKMYPNGWGKFIKMYVHGWVFSQNIAKKSKKMSIFFQIFACGALKLLKKSVLGWVDGQKVGTWVGGFPKVEIDHMYPTIYISTPPPGYT